MCPCQNGASEQQSAEKSEMVQVPLNGSTSAHSVASTAAASNGVNGHANGTANGTAPRPQRPINPYAPRASDFLSNVSNFKIIESTLRGTFPLGSTSDWGGRRS